MVYLTGKPANKVSTVVHRQNLRSFHGPCSGFSLLEVLISLLIFTVGFLGLASLQHIAMKLTHDAVLQNTAADLAESLLTQVRVEGNSNNISVWQVRVSESLPDGKGSLIKQGDNLTVTLQWQESTHSAKPGAPQEYRLSFK